MIRKKLIVTIVLAMSTFFATGQMVRTIAEHISIRDGLHTDEAGNIYVASGGFAGNTIGVYNKESEIFDPNFVQGLLGPVDVDVYKDSLFVMTNYDNNTVVSYNPSSGETTIIATGLDGPSGIVVDDESNIYVASWGGAPSYQGRWIHKIDGQTGEVRMIVDSDLLNRPQAMTINHEGDIIVYGKHNLYKLNPQDETLEFWTTIGIKLGHMVFSNRDTCLYGTAVDLHKIVKIDAEGNLSFIAGNSAGYVDGDATVAKFRNPLGIEISSDESTLYISENGYGAGPGRLRSMDLDVVLSASDKMVEGLDIYPNPTTGTIYFKNMGGEQLTLEVYDMQGRKRTVKKSGSREVSLSLSDLAPGLYSIRVIGKRGIQTQTIYKQ